MSNRRSATKSWFVIVNGGMNPHGYLQMSLPRRKTCPRVTGTRAKSCLDSSCNSLIPWWSSYVADVEIVGSHGDCHAEQPRTGHGQRDLVRTFHGGWSSGWSIQNGFYDPQ